MIDAAAVAAARVMLMAWAPPTLGVVDKFNVMEQVEVFETDYGAFDSLNKV